MQYSIHSRRSEPVNYSRHGLVEWYVTDEIGRWVHCEPFLTKKTAETFLGEFLQYIKAIKAKATTTAE